jgi:hypothetical protein
VRAAWTSLIVLAAVLAANTAYARDREETCTSAQRATGTIVTDCRAHGRKPRHCESYQHATGTVTTDCR